MTDTTNVPALLAVLERKAIRYQNSHAVSEAVRQDISPFDLDEMLFIIQHLQTVLVPTVS